MIRVLKWNWYFAFRKKTFQEIIKLILKCIMLEICTPEYNNCTKYLQKGTFIPEFTEEKNSQYKIICKEVNIWKDWRFYNGQTLVQMEVLIPTNWLQLSYLISSSGVNILVTLSWQEGVLAQSSEIIHKVCPRPLQESCQGGTVLPERRKVNRNRIPHLVQLLAHTTRLKLTSLSCFKSAPNCIFCSVLASE